MSLPSKILIGLFFAVALFLIGYNVGLHHEKTTEQVRTGQALEAAVVKHDQAASAGAAVEAKAADHAAATDAAFTKITQKEVVYVQKHPDSPACRLDADGVRLWQSANAGTDPDGTGQPDSQVPGSAPVAERQPQ